MEKDPATGSRRVNIMKRDKHMASVNFATVPLSNSRLPAVLMSQMEVAARARRKPGSRARILC